MRILFRRVLLPDRPGVQAILAEGGLIAWIGADADAASLVDGRVRVLDLDGALVLPAFVDAHVHVTETGLLLDGVDLSGTRSVRQVLDLVAAAAAARPGRAVLGHGWDELQLAEGRAPTGAELDRAGSGLPVYLSRVDVHSAVISGALAERSRAAGLTGWDGSGRVERDAHHAARHSTRFALETRERRRLQLLALRAAAAAGIGELHEMSAPHVAPAGDLVSLLELADAGADAGAGAADPVGALPEVVPYRGELARDEDDARRIGTDLKAAGLTRLAGLAGDLMVDGSFGSRTAALNQDYADTPGHRGHLYLDVAQVRDHVIACTRTGLQAGFHVIGDAAVDTMLAGFEAAAAVLGTGSLRAAGHRIEHLESISAPDAATVGRLGLVASVQPAFDAAWGGPDRMYAIRLGARRAIALNPFAALVAAGVTLAFGSDSPVTPFAPWESIRAALLHRTPAQRIDLATAIGAHSAGGRVAGRGPDATGREDAVVRVGAAATFAGWRSPALAGGRDELAAVAEELMGGGPVPECVVTVINGRIAEIPEAATSRPFGKLS